MKRGKVHTRYEGKTYTIVPAVKAETCEGCAFEGNSVNCPHTERDWWNCSAVDGMPDVILIAPTKEARLEYVKRRLAA